MKTKKLLAGLLSFTMIAATLATPLGGTINGVLDNFSLSANAETSGDYEYDVLDDGTVEVTSYVGSDTNVVIPSEINGKKVTSIGDAAFGGIWDDDEQKYISDITSVTIPNSVTSIGDYAFSYCTSLASITIGNSVTSIEDRAFENCTSLTNITIPNSVTNIGDDAFSGCTSLTSITIPNSVTSIGDYAFYYCTSLTSVTIGNSVTDIGKGAFFGCASLTSVAIPNSVTSIGWGTFANCTGLTSLMIPNSVTNIGEYAFAGSSLTSITIPDSVTSIGDRAFYGCKSLASVTIPDSVTSIGAEAFDGCTNLTSVTIGNSVASIGGWAFLGCTSLTSVTIPKSVKSIEYCAFGYMFDLNSLKEIKINGFKIKCYAGTAGEKYAKDNGFKYELLDKVSVPVISGAKATGTTYNSIKLSWNKTSGVDGYVVYRYDDAKKTWIRLAKISNPNTTSYTVTGLASAKQHQIAVKGYLTIDGKEVGSPKLSIVKATTNPGVVSNFKTSANASNSVKLTWSKVNGAEGYIVYRYNPSNKGWIRLAKIKGTSYTATGLASGTSYKFAVKSYITLNGKEFGGSKLTQVFTSTNPDKVNFTVTSPSAGRADFKWSKVRGATGYIVYYKANAKDVWHRLTVTSGTSYTFMGLKVKNNYTFTVKAYRNAASKTFNGGFDVKQLKIKGNYGWNNVNGKRYYFYSNGIMAKNTYINGYQITASGAMSNTALNLQNKIKSIINNNTKSTQTQEQKLKSCYDYVSKSYSYKHYNNFKNTSDWQMNYAYRMINDYKGNCYMYAAAFAFMARELGYDAKCIPGRVTSAGGGYIPHCWVEIKINGVNYMFDTELNYEFRSRGLYANLFKFLPNKTPMNLTYLK